jgi:hypothetical protein
MRADRVAARGLAVSGAMVATPVLADGAEGGSRSVPGTRASVSSHNSVRRSELDQRLVRRRNEFSDITRSYTRKGVVRYN